MILITGATGQLGGRVIETLLNYNIPAGQIAALVRDEAKAESLKVKGINLRIGNYDDVDALNIAMQGIEKVLLVSALEEGKIVQQHKNVIDAAKRAGVQCLAYTSHCLQNRETLHNPIMLTHYETEDYLMASGLKYIIFRNILYMDSMALYMLGRDYLDNGINLPAGDGRVAYALRCDQAEAIGHVLAAGDCSNRIYRFTGSRAYSFTDVAQSLSELTGKTVSYRPVSAETYRTNALNGGMPQKVVDLILPFMADIAGGQGSTVTNDMEEALGRPPIDLKAGLKQLLNL
ncbi:SDR family oxidoreductase [Mucilaginibacter sp. CSA2-8R]|uniref:SDR family oxidoreductase n=1 Tax=Mucilaginibacter sp. CSA2-8R TaxID=3141542 RepID=UPI00315D0FD2